MKENVNTTNSPEIDWRAEYWKGVRDYIEQGDRLIEAHQRIIELTKELTELRMQLQELRAQVSPSKADQKPKGLLMKLTR